MKHENNLTLKVRWIEKLSLLYYTQIIKKKKCFGLFFGHKSAVPKMRKRKIFGRYRLRNRLKTFLMTKINNFIYIWIALSVLYPNLKAVLYYMWNCPNYKGLKWNFFNFSRSYFCYNLFSMTDNCIRLSGICLRYNLK